MGQRIEGPAEVILIVEDEAFVRHDLVDFFSEMGFDVFDARSADEAIEILEAQPSIEIVFTDVQMPGSMDGERLAHVVRDRFPPTILVVASGVRMRHQLHLPAGSIFVPKPFDPRAVLRSIRDAQAG